MIVGVDFLDLSAVPDTRGSLVTLHAEGPGAQRWPQWNWIRSEPNVLRGMHVHLFYDEYYVPMQGSMFFGLADTRPHSPTYRQVMGFRWQGRDQAFVVPKGVAHGVYCEEASMLVYGLTNVFDGTGELGCRFDDPELEIDWPTHEPMLSERDSSAGTFADLLASYAAFEEREACSRSTHR